MKDTVLSFGLQYVIYGLEVCVIAALFCRARWKRLTSPFLYVIWLAAIDILARPYMFHHYGLNSKVYAYFYWLSDVALALAAFALVGAFFRRACESEERMWRFLRLLLSFIFILVLGISSFTLLRNYDHLFTTFIYEFGQNLYFTCLVLNTLLYLLMQQLESTDDELGLLVCGMGIQFAGPAACLALLYLTSGQHYAKSLIGLISPLCTFGMLVTWLYAVVHVPPPEVLRAGENVPALANASVPRS